MKGVNRFVRNSGVKSSARSECLDWSSVFLSVYPCSSCHAEPSDTRESDRTETKTLPERAVAHKLNVADNGL